jgi:hypothetical protein
MADWVMTPIAAVGVSIALAIILACIGVWRGWLWMTGDGGMQRVFIFTSQAIRYSLFAGAVSVGRCVVTLLVYPVLLTAAAFLTLCTLLWWRWPQRQAAPRLAGQSAMRGRLAEPYDRVALRHG